MKTIKMICTVVAVAIIVTAGVCIANIHLAAWSLVCAGTGFAVCAMWKLKT